MKNLILRIFGRLLRGYEPHRVEESKRQFAHCGREVMIESTAVIWPASGLHVGDNCVINGHTFIFAGGGVRIGSGTMNSAGCLISSVTHPKASVRNLRYAIFLYAEKHPEQVPGLRATFSPLSLLRRIKHNVFQRSWLQPVSSYWTLASELYSWWLIHLELKSQSSIVQARENWARCCNSSLRVAGHCSSLTPSMRNS